MFILCRDSKVALPKKVGEVSSPSIPRVDESSRQHSLHLEKLKLDYEAKLHALTKKEHELDKKLLEVDTTIERRAKELVAKIATDIAVPGPDG